MRLPSSRFVTSLALFTCLTGLPLSAIPVNPSVGTITAPNLTTAGTTSYTFTVSYTPSSGHTIVAGSIDTSDVTVTGPGGANTITYASWDAGTSTATYAFKAPGGVWDSSDNGTYTIGVVGSQVSDTGAGTVPANSSAATFTVSAPAYTSPSGTGTGAQAASVYFSSYASLTSYTNQLDSTPIGTMTRGASGTGGLSVNNISGASANVAAALWADFNDDGDFDDPGELVKTISSTALVANGNNWFSNSSGLARMPINFPGNQLRLRVIGVLGTTVPSGPEITGYTGDYVDAILTVATNTAPTLDTGLTYTLTDIVSDDTDPVGFTVSSLIDDAGNAITDPDASASSYEGVAVIGGTGNGVWQYSTDSGATWTSATSLGDDHAILLSKTTTNRLRFLPTSPGSYSMTFRAWDRTEGNNGDLYNITAEGGTGGTNAFSTQSVTLTASVADASTGGGSTLYIGGNDLGRFFAAALDETAGTALPARTLFAADEALYAYQFFYDADDGYLYWAQNYGNLYRSLPDGSDLTALTTYDTNNDGGIVGFGLSGSTLRYLFNDYNANDFQVYSATAGGSITPSALSILSTPNYYGSIEWDGSSIFVNQTSPSQAILSTDASGASAASLATVTSGSYLYAVAHDDTRLFWVESDGDTVHALKSVPKTGGSPTTLGTPPGIPSGLVVDADHGFIYISTEYPNAIYRTDYPNGGTFTKVIDLPFLPIGLALRLGAPANHAPTNLALSSATANQSSGAGATIGTLTTTDADSADSHTYSFVTGTGDTDNGSFALVDDTLEVGASPLGAGDYSVRLQTDDGNGGTYAKAFTITISDDVGPTISSVSVPADGTYPAYRPLLFEVHFNEAVTVNLGGGTPRIAYTIGGSTRYATYSYGSGTTTLGFYGGTQADDLDTDGITIGSVIEASGGTLRDAAGNDATLTFTAPSTTGILVEGILPYVVSIVRHTPASQNVHTTTVVFTVTFSEAVTGVTTDSFTVTAVGGSSIVASVTSVSGSGTTYEVTVDVSSGTGEFRLDPALPPG